MFKSKTNSSTQSSYSDSKILKKEHYHPIRKLLVFQLKLAIDALRDILLSPISIIATIIDLIQGRKEKDSYFSALMKFGRDSESHINLFDQHAGEKQTVDNLFNKVEYAVKKEIKKNESKKS